MRALPMLAIFAALAACAPTSVDDRAIVTLPSESLPNAAPPSVDAVVEQEDAEPKLADIELCDARDYRPLIGSDVKATTFLSGPALRVFGVNDIITQDYVPQRTNVVFDDGGTITRVYCG